MDVDSRVLDASSGTRLLNALDRFTSAVELKLGQALSFAAHNIAVKTLLVDTKAANQSHRFSFRPSFTNAKPDQPANATLVVMAVFFSRFSIKNPWENP